MGCAEAYDIFLNFVRDRMNAAQVRYNEEYSPYSNEYPAGALEALKSMYEDLRTNKTMFLVTCHRAQEYKGK